MEQIYHEDNKEVSGSLSHTVLPKALGGQLIIFCHLFEIF